MQQSSLRSRHRVVSHARVSVAGRNSHGVAAFVRELKTKCAAQTDESVLRRGSLPHAAGARRAVRPATSRRTQASGGGEGGAGGNGGGEDSGTGGGAACGVESAAVDEAVSMAVSKRARGGGGGGDDAGGNEAGDDDVLTALALVSVRRNASTSGEVLTRSSSAMSMRAAAPIRTSLTRPFSSSRGCSVSPSSSSGTTVAYALTRFMARLLPDGELAAVGRSAASQSSSSFDRRVSSASSCASSVGTCFFARTLVRAVRVDARGSLGMCTSQSTHRPPVERLRKKTQSSELVAGASSHTTHAT